jgi:hypothetical protein
MAAWAFLSESDTCSRPYSSFVRAVSRVAPILAITAAYAVWPGYCQETPTVDVIMAKVAENQERAEKARTAYLYKQHIVVTSRRTNGKLMCEEKTDYRVLPSETGLEKEQTRFEGKLWRKRSYITYISENDEKSATKITPDDVSIQIPDSAIDTGLVRGFRDALANDKAKDGFGKDLFPLTAEEQKQYQFQLVGREQRVAQASACGCHGDVYRVRFRPKDRHEIIWAGEALIDAAEFEPVTISTKLSRSIPFLVKTLLGTDVPGIGFSVAYRRVADGLWFPISFGTEFRLHALFFLNRTLAVSLENKDFQQASAESTIHYQPPQVNP